MFRTGGCAAIIRIEDVSFHYGEAHEQCLHDVSLHIERGECVLLCGESGCGKTTVTRLVNGLIPHFYEGEFSGRVSVAGHNLADTKPEALAHIVGSVFQNPRSQFFNLDTTGEIAFGCENLGMPAAQIQERVRLAAHELDISNLLDRDIFALSGGEKQKVAVASTYALNPDIFVFDEPTANLDGNACWELAELMKKLKAQGKTLVIAEHRLYWLNGLIDRAVYMKGGEILHTWTQDEFLALTGAQREKLGLRAVHLDTLCVACPERTVPAPAFAVNNLTARYKRAKPVLKNVSFAAAPGEVIGIVGKNGQGKSTLARTLCGLHRESGGSVMLDGKALRSKSRAGPVYLVMQESGYQLFTDSVENELRLSKSKKDRPSDAKVDAILDSLNLAELRGRHPMSLSGGEKQRTAIAAAMAAGAQILIFDEPTSGLDFANMRRVAQALSDLAEGGKAVLVITHDFELLVCACTRVLLVDDGKIRSDTSANLKKLLTTKEISK